MKIIKIEPTPSPNTMKVLINKVLPSQKRFHYTDKNKEQAPSEIQQLFSIEGIKSVYHVANFLAIERNPKINWQSILHGIKEVFGEEDAVANYNETAPSLGEKRVFVQYFLDIPMQIKVEDEEGEQRFGLDKRFKEAIFTLQQYGGNVVMERKWVEQGVRFGEKEEIGVEVVEELEAAYSEQRLSELLAPHVGEGTLVQERQIYQIVPLEMFQVEDWKVRYELLHRLNPTVQDLPLLEQALKDEKVAVRRLATAYLGIIGEKEVLPLVYQAMEDSSVSIRRTAGDVLSDLGYTEAIPVMIKALEDKNKLVRWRAAMFLYESGNELAIAALQKATEDIEFEVSLQAQMALERIQRGEESKGSIWKQMLEVRRKVE